MTIEQDILRTNNWGALRILHGEILSLIDSNIENYKSKEVLEENNKLVRDYISYLISLTSLGENLKVKERLREIYVFVNKLITQAGRQGDLEKFNHAKDILQPIYSAYLEREKLEGEKVLSGLTYGEARLIEYGSSGNFNIEG